MTDRERVMGLLEELAQDDWVLRFNDNDVKETAKAALTLLKEQEAKNVIAEKHKILLDDSYDEAQFGEDTFYHCPSCNRNLSRTHMNKDIHFCSSCGQAVKWE